MCKFIDWAKNKKVTTIPKINDDKCFQYAVTATPSHQNLKNHVERTSEIIPSINNYNWK